MKLFRLILICLLAGLILNSCKKDSTTVTLVGNWVRMSDFTGNARSEAVSFTLKGKAYVGLGYDGKTRLKDFWQYDIGTGSGSWTQVADFLGAGRTSATAFASDTKGYVATGNDGTNYLADAWEYDPDLNSWKQVSTLKQVKIANGDTITYWGSRYEAVSFCINNIGYLGTGYNGSYLNDFWRFDPTVGDSGTWTKTADIGRKRTGATAFVIDGKGYVCCGVADGTYNVDFSRFDPSTQSWSPLNAIANLSDLTFDDDYAIIRQYGVAFVIDGKAYVTAGLHSSPLADTWEYDLGTDIWTQKTAFEGATRFGTVAFTLNNRGFVATGRSSSGRFQDTWEFKPNDDVDANDNY